MRKLAGNLNRTQTLCLFVNQIREKVGVMFGSPETQPGGRALKFYSSQRLDIRRIETLKDGTEAVGNRVRVKVVKNKVAAPFRQAEFDIEFGKGISTSGCILDLGIEHNIVTKSGSFFSYGDERLGQGRNNAKALLDEHPEVAKEIEGKVYEALGIGQDLVTPIERDGRRRGRRGRRRGAAGRGGRRRGGRPPAEAPATSTPAEARPARARASPGGAEPARAHGGRAARGCSPASASSPAVDRPGASASCVEQGYLDDAGYAQRFAEDRRRLDGWGAERIERRLRGARRRPGAHRRRARRSDREDELDAALALLRRRFPRAAGDAARARPRARRCSSARATSSSSRYDALRRHAGVAEFD